MVGESGGARLRCSGGLDDAAGPSVRVVRKVRQNAVPIGPAGSITVCVVGNLAGGGRRAGGGEPVDLGHLRRPLERREFVDGLGAQGVSDSAAAIAVVVGDLEEIDAA